MDFENNCGKKEKMLVTGIITSIPTIFSSILKNDFIICAKLDLLSKNVSIQTSPIFIV